MEKYVPWLIAGFVVLTMMDRSDQKSAQDAAEREKDRKAAAWQSLMGFGTTAAGLAAKVTDFAGGLVAMVGGSTTPAGGTSTNAAAEPMTAPELLEQGY